jgi:hypothetical protein
VARARHSLAIALVCFLSACGHEQSSPERAQVTAASATAAATVNGQVITLNEVSALCNETGLSPRTALQRLVVERLLLQHAEAGRYEEHAAVQRGLAQARVRALLAEAVERGTTEDATAERKRKLDALLSALSRSTAVKVHEAALARLSEAPP